MAKELVEQNQGALGASALFGGTIALVAFAYVIIALNAMRAGLLSRFMGVLGIIVGALIVLPCRRASRSSRCSGSARWEACSWEHGPAAAAPRGRRANPTVADAGAANGTPAGRGGRRGARWTNRSQESDRPSPRRSASAAPPLGDRRPRQAPQRHVHVLLGELGSSSVPAR